MKRKIVTIILGVIVVLSIIFNAAFYIPLMLGLYTLIILIATLTYHKRLYYLQDIEIKSETEIPDHIIKLFGEPKSKLLEIGFNFSHWQKAWFPFFDDEIPKWNMVFFNSKTSTYATISNTELKLTFKPYYITYYSLFENNKQVISYGKPWSQIPRILHDSYIFISKSFEPSEVFKEHNVNILCVEKLSNLLCNTKEDFVEIQNKFLVRHFDKMIQENKMKKVDNHVFRFTFFVTFKSMIKSLNTTFLNITQLINAPKLKEVDIPIDLKLELYLETKKVHKQNEQYRYIQSPRTFFTISIVISLISFSFLFSLKDAIIFLLVLLLHELGHYLSMLYYNLKNVNITFIPFLGAVTYSDDKYLPAYQRFIIYLSGPIWGLILGVSLYYYYPAMGSWPIIALIFINYLNLLPILPFDGGRIVDLLISHSFPRLSLLLHLFSIFALLFISYLTGDYFWGIIAIILIPTLITNYSSIQTYNEIHKNNPDIDTLSSEQFAKKVLEISSKFNSNIKQKIPTTVLMIDTIKSMCERKKVSSLGVILGMTIYIVTLLLPYGIFNNVYAYKSDIFMYLKFRTKINQLQKKIKATPNNLYYNIELAKIYGKNLFWSKNLGIDICRHILSLDPQYAPAYALLAEVYEWLNIKIASKFLRKAIETCKVPKIFLKRSFYEPLQDYYFRYLFLHKKSFDFFALVKVVKQFDSGKQEKSSLSSFIIAFDKELKEEYLPAIHLYNTALQYTNIRDFERSKSLKARLRTCYFLARIQNKLVIHSPFKLWQLILSNKFYAMNCAVAFVNKELSNKELKKKSCYPFLIRIISVFP